MLKKSNKNASLTRMPQLIKYLYAGLLEVTFKDGEDNHK